jgi:mRNA interferase RelE/StbE
VAAYDIRIKASATKELSRLGTKKDRQRLVAAITVLGADPRPAGSEKLVGSDGLYRLRVGDHRVIYEIRDTELVVVVIKIGHRRDVYR